MTFPHGFSTYEKSFYAGTGRSIAVEGQQKARPGIGKRKSGLANLGWQNGAD